MTDIVVLNSFIERDYSLMRMYENLKAFYSEYNFARKTFYSELGGLAYELFFILIIPI